MSKFHPVVPVILFWRMGSNLGDEVGMGFDSDKHRPLKWNTVFFDLSTSTIKTYYNTPRLDKIFFGSMVPLATVNRWKESHYLYIITTENADFSLKIHIVWLFDCSFLFTSSFSEQPRSLMIINCLFCKTMKDMRWKKQQQNKNNDLQKMFKKLNQSRTKPKLLTLYFILLDKSSRSFILPFL